MSICVVLSFPGAIGAAAARLILRAEEISHRRRPRVPDRERPWWNGVSRPLAGRSAGETFAVRFEATNVGDQTASSVIVRATLSEGDREGEALEVTIDYLPGRSTASEGFIFKSDPAEFKLEGDCW